VRSLPQSDTWAGTDDTEVTPHITKPSRDVIAVDICTRLREIIDTYLALGYITSIIHCLGHKTSKAFLCTQYTFLRFLFLFYTTRLRSNAMSAQLAQCRTQVKLLVKGIQRQSHTACTRLLEAWESMDLAPNSISYVGITIVAIIWLISTLITRRRTQRRQQTTRPNTPNLEKRLTERQTGGTPSFICIATVYFQSAFFTSLTDSSSVASILLPASHGKPIPFMVPE
jgi:hypothetical protein